MPAFDVRIYKSWNARNLNEAWVNNYVINFDGNVESPGWITVIDNLAAAEKILHLQGVQYLHATVSTTMDEPVYNPKSLRVFGLQGTGNRAIPEGDVAVDLNVALKMKKEVAYGRAGTMFFRGALLSSDVEINDRGESQIPAVGSLLASPVLIANVNQAYNAIPEGFDWVMKVPEMDDPAQQENITARLVLTVGIGGISVNKRNHRWFDKRAKVTAPA